MKLATACPHTHRKHYALGMCGACYNAGRPEAETIPASRATADLLKEIAAARQCSIRILIDELLPIERLEDEKVKALRSQHERLSRELKELEANGSSN